MTKELALYESARAALAKAVKVDEVKEIRNKAMAIKAAAKIAKDREMEANAYELRARAERRLGEMMEVQPKAKGGEHGGKKPLDGIRKNPSNPVATLAEAGIDKNLAHRARAAAKRPEKIFEEDIAWHRQQILNPPPTYHELKDARRARRNAEHQAATARKEKRAPDALEIIECAERAERREQHANRAAEPVAEIILSKRGTQSAAPEIISPNFTTKGAVNPTRLAEAMRSIKQNLRLAYALSDRATFFKHARDMLDELERELVPESAEATA